MDLTYTPEEQAFREEVRSFVRARLPPQLAAKVHAGQRLHKEDFLTWHRIMHAQGWAGVKWPKQFGGTGWTSTQQYIFDEEAADAGAPPLMPFGLKMVGPVIMAFGNPTQQQYFLPRILSGEHWWCQGYSEPGAGSDLASLKTRAERRGDKYIVNGQKTWNTLGQFADWIFCLVRTSPEGRPQTGISFLLIDMKTPGITVRPIYTLDREHEVNEVWFQDVEVPVENLVGEENKGWTYAKFLLGHERTNIAGVGVSKRELKRLKALAAQVQDGGRPLLQNPRFRDKIAELEIDLMALEITNLRLLAAERENKAPGPEASMLKVRGSEIQQRLTELMMLAVGPQAMPFLFDAMEAGWQGEPVGAEGWTEVIAPLTSHYLNYRKVSIYGGSNEIQKNIIAQMVLGL
jgi:alkylation response protein AidB-like acyl-CoA dehydrogenase